MPSEDARAQRKVPRGDLASVAPANAAAAKEEFLAKKVGSFHACAPPHVALILHLAQSCVAPRFIYQSSALSRGLALAAFSHSDKYSGAAVHVLRRVLAQFGSWTQWEQHCNAGFLPPDEVDRRVALYLTRLSCQHVISVAWDPNIVAPTMLAGRRLLLRGPYREGRVQSVRTRLPARCRRRSSARQLLFTLTCGGRCWTTKSARTSCGSTTASCSRWPRAGPSSRYKYAWSQKRCRQRGPSRLHISQPMPPSGSGKHQHGAGAAPREVARLSQRLLYYMYTILYLERRASRSRSPSSSTRR